MKSGLLVAMALVALFGLAPRAGAQAPRTDAIWARTTDGAAITLDGKLNEPAWALAESVVVQYGVIAADPGSGYKVEGGILPSDKTFATLKFLVVGNYLYLGATCRDSSIEGSRDFNRFDGFLISLKDHSDPAHPKPPAEYTYTWWYPDTVAMPTIGPTTPPGFIGKWATYPPGTARTPQQIDAWDAVTTWHGTANKDTTNAGTIANDTSYTVEMKFNLAPMGYDVTQANGDIVEWNISIYDVDWLYLRPSLSNIRLSANRVWLQSPWDNAMWYDEMHIYSKPGVTIHSGALPTIQPEFRVPNGQNFPDVVVDGSLSDAVWSTAPKFKIQYGNDDLRANYPGVGTYRAGEYQPSVNGGQASIGDTSANATVQYFFKADTLYLGFDVKDKGVQYSTNVDRYDGFIVTIGDRAARQTLDHNLQVKRLTFQVGPTGAAIPQDSLPNLINVGGAKVAIALKPGTTVDTVGSPPDQGYTAELAIVLPKIGYPAGRGDGTVWLGVDWMNGTSYGGDFEFSYATRTWWFRQYEYECCPAWGYLDPGNVLVGVESPEAAHQPRLALLGNTPNPFRSNTIIRYRLGTPGRVSLDVYDVGGRRVATRNLGLLDAGDQVASFERGRLGAGVYQYRLSVTGNTGLVEAVDSGRMLLLK